MVRRSDDGTDAEEDYDTGSMLDEDVEREEEKPNKPKRKKENDADWWKRGEAPPF
jgi:hypothetical protein